MDIRYIKDSDKIEYIAMAKTFYDSPAVMAKIPDKHFEDTFSQLMRNRDFARCYILEEDKKIIGYGLTARTFSQEAGGISVFIEELYIKPDYRSKGYGKQFFEFLFNEEKDAKRFRLEVEEENQGAIRLYKKIGFDFLEYLQMYIQR